MIKRILCLLALMLAYSPYAFSINKMDPTNSGFTLLSSKNYDSSTKDITNGQYIGGGFASILLGFGIGHAIQGRYLEKGWIFSVSELGLLSGSLSSLFLAELLEPGKVKCFMGPCEPFKEEKVISDTLTKFSFALLVVLGAVKAWEIVDAWMLPSHYKVVKESPFQLTPLAYYNQKNMNLGLSLQYKF